MSEAYGDIRTRIRPAMQHRAKPAVLHEVTLAAHPQRSHLHSGRSGGDDGCHKLPALETAKSPSIGTDCGQRKHRHNLEHLRSKAWQHGIR